MREITGEDIAKPVTEGVAQATTPDSRRATITVFPHLRKRFASNLATKSRTLSILLASSPPFRILMFGSSISMFGSRISTIAFPMLVLHLNNSPLITGLVAFAVIAPSILVYIPAGVLVDRWNPRRVMLISEWLRGVAIASVVAMLVAFRGHPSIWFLMFAMVAEEILEIFFMLADRRYLSGLMDRESKTSMTSQQSYVEVRAHAVILAGRPLGPFLFEISPFWPFLADALSFLFSIASLFVIRRSDKPARKSVKMPRGQLMRDIAQGFSWLRRDRRAWLSMVLLALTSLVAQALILMFLSEAHSKELSTVSIGIVLAASGAGGVAGSLFSRVLSEGIRRFWLPIQMGAWCVALALLTISGGLSVFWSAVAMLILGLTGAIGNIEFGTYLVANVADDMIARVTGIGQMAAIAATAVGPVVGGAAVQHYGIRGAEGFLLVFVILLAFLSLLTPAVSQRLASAFRMSSLSSSAWRSKRINIASEISGAAPRGREHNQDIRREFIEEGADFLSMCELVDHGRLA